MAPETAAAASPSTIGLSKTGPGSVLAGLAAGFTLRATNPAGGTAAPEYNTSFRDVLAPGVTYRAGSTVPADAGDPTVVTRQVEFPANSGRTVPQQTLIWSNVADLPVNGELTLRYQAVPDADLYPVGATFANTAQDWASTDPRLVPKFTSAGAPVDGATIAAGPARTVETSVTAITIAKSDDASPEGKLLRGVHDDVSVYSLLVTNNGVDPTTGIQVVDLVPADEEFLACGDVDNSADVEYPGAPTLGQGRRPADGCLQPDRVETVTDPAPLTGVWTRVTWTIPDLPAKATYTLRYAAAVPLRAQTTDFGGPTPGTGGAQAADLDNNGGASTRQVGGGQAVPNTASVSGTYTGATTGDPTGATGTPVSDSDTLTVTAKDVRVLKTVRTDGTGWAKQDRFVEGDLATYRLEVDTSEYTSASDIVLTDVLPNGVCPVVTADQWSALVADHPVLAGVQGCTAGEGQGPQIDDGSTIGYSSVAYDEASGSFTTTFTPIAALAAQSTVLVTYPVRMLVTYPGGSVAGTDTSSGDTFANTASLTATTTPVEGSPESGPATVTDSSSASLVTGGPQIAKLLEPLPVTPATDYSCAAGGYVDPTDPQLPAARTTFALGDLACFELRVQFAAGARTRNATVTDFLPAGTSYVAGSATLGPDNTVPAGDVALDESAAGSGTLTWTLGRTAAGVRLIDPGRTFVVRIAVRITDPADPGKVDITGNLMKLRQENSAGAATSLRDRVDFSIAPAIPLSVTKGVASVDGSPAGDNPADTDHRQVRQGSVVDFRVDVRHGGTAATGTDRPVSDIAVWDVLPAPFTCADVQAQAGLECRDAGALGDWHPAVTGRSVLRTTLAGPVAAGGTLRWDYRVTVPEIGPSLDPVNTTYLSSWVSDADDGAAGTTYYAAGNIDTDVPAADQLAPAAADSSDVFTAAVAAGKSVTSAIAETGNNGAGQAAIGELLTFTLSARIPAGLTVRSASLSDVLPAGVELRTGAVPPTAALAPDAADPATTESLPDGFELDPATGVLTFPASYTNTTATDQLVLVSLAGRFTTAAGTQGSTVTNRARLTWTPVGGTATSVDGTATATVVEPLPTLAKTVSAGPYTAGQTVTYQLTAGNTAGRPTAYDTWVVDCVPAGLTVTGYVAGSPSRGTADDPVAGTGTGAGGNGCAAGTTRVGWHTGDLPGGVSGSLSYTAVISPSAAGGQSYVNTASLSAVSIPGTPRTGPSDAVPDGARTSTASSGRTVRVTVPALTKTASPTQSNVGGTVTYTVTTTVPAQVNLYNAVLRDLLPAGLDATRLTTVSLTCTQTPGSCTVPQNAPTTAANGSSVLATWSLGDLTAQPAARTLTLVYTVPVADAAAAVRGAGLTNGAAIEWNTTAGGGLPPFSAADIPAAGKVRVTVTEPVVRVAKTVDDTTPDPGQVFRYTLTAANGGQAGDTNVGPAYSVTVRDAVPAGVVIDPTGLPAGTTLTGTAANGSGGTLTWTIPGPLAAGSANAVSVGYPARLAPSATLTDAGQRNTATVTDVYSQPSAGGRHSTPLTTASTTVTPQFPRIVPAKEAVSTGPAYAGSAFTWRLTLTNSGTARGYGVTATDVLPQHWTYRTGSAQVVVAGAAPVATEPSVTAAAGSDGPTLSWSGLAPLGADPTTSGLAPGQSVVVTFDAVPDADAPTSAGTAAANTNRVTATVADATGATANGSADYAAGTGTAVARIAAADLRLVKTAGTFTAGGTGSWTLTASNRGPDPAVGPFNLTDTVPATLTLPGGGTGAALTVLSATGTGWSCTVDQGTRRVACGRIAGGETLASGSSFPAVTVTVSVPADAVSGSTATNGGAVAARTFDPDTTNNAATATGTVATQADLRITKEATGTLVAGRDAGYRLQVTNLGPSVSLASAGTPVTVTDTLPAGTTFVSAEGTGWSCAPPAGRVLTCTWTATLEVNAATDPLQVTVAVPAARTADVVNQAAVTPGGTPDTDGRGGANTATVTGTPAQLADLGAGKVLVDKAGTPVVAGTVRQYALSVTNHGPSDATGVTLTDALPAPLTYAGSYTSTTGSWTCTVAGRTVTCALDGSLPGPVDGVPQTRTVTVSVRVPAGYDTTQPLVNTVTAASATTDPGPTPNTDTDNSSVSAEADLALDKTITVDAVAGRSMTYRLQAHNRGPSVAAGPTVVRDTLPAGLSFDPAAPPTGAGWTCTVDTADRTVECRHPDPVAVDEGDTPDAAPIDVPVLVAEGTRGPVVNRAAISGPLTDPDPSNDAVERSTPVAELAEVSITKTAAAATVVAGRDTTYTLTVTDAGPSTARGLTVVDTPDPGLTVTALSGDGWDCDVPTRTCTRDALAVADGPSAITVTARAGAAVPDGTRLVNRADLTVGTPHPAGDPAWHDEATVTVDTVAGVSLTKTHDADADPVLAGTTLTFRLTAANRGPSDAVGPVTVTDTLPAGMTYLSSSGPWTCTAGAALTCTLDGPDARIAAGGSAPELDLLVRVDPAVRDGSLTNRADVRTGTAQDPDVPTGAEDSVPVETRADLAVTKTHTGTAAAGRPFTWTVTVADLGPSVSAADDDHPITVTDTLPAGTTLVSGGGNGFRCAVADDDAQQVVCRRAADLAVDTADTPAAVAFPVTVAVAPSVTAPLTNTVTVAPGATPQPDGTEANDTATDTAEIDEVADLSVTKTHPAGETAVAGRPFSWTITVTNAGPAWSAASAATPVVLTDTLPDGVTFSGSRSDDWTCAVDENDPAQVRCVATAPLTLGDHALTLTGTVDPAALGDPGDPDAAGTLTNAVEITGWTTPDPSTDDHWATDQVPLGTSADLSVVKSHDAAAEPAVPGQQFTWTLQVTNRGPSVSRADADHLVTVTDTLPDGVDFVSGTGQGWTCTADGPDVTCTWGSTDDPTDLPVGDAPPITLVASVDAGTTGELVNSATVHTGLTTDPEPANDTSRDAAVPVGPQADLSITKTHDPAAVVIGNPLDFTLTVTNLGPSTATGVVVTDTLPVGLFDAPAGSAAAPSVDAPDGWTCTVDAPTPTGQELRCTLAGGLSPVTVSSGSAQVFTVHAAVTADAYPEVANTATVDATTADPVTENDTATDTVTVPAVADLALAKTLTGGLTVGKQAQYRLTVTNGGPTADPGPIVVTDELPAGLTAVAAAGTGPAADALCELGGTVTCVLPDALAVDDSLTVVVTVDVGPTAYPTVVNTATVDSPADDRNPSNDTATLTSPVTPAVGLALAKTLRSSTPDAAGLLHWDLTVTNAGPNVSDRPFTVGDTLPDGLTYRGAEAGPGWTCSAAGQAVTCTFDGTLKVGSDATVTVDTAVTAPAGTVLTNRARLSGTGVTVQVAGAAYTVPQTAPPTPPTTPPTTPPSTTPPGTTPPGTTPPDSGTTTPAPGTTVTTVTTVPPGGPTDTGSPSAGGELPNTGFDLWPKLLLALTLIGVGLVVTATGRRRPRRH
ncbi:isopeptide-forming domain-containing fimbrial protein [Nakamurella endophytica]|uniref:isopeptide-forming domain-containing fimbrial protein n=1 Tax=Nakamurella endophytica TaxID=1748367 RepID=UPI0016643230|nr:isopeptide-forming domain-containing fimbrial protein [Nakamurella endophytica]